MKRTLLLLGAVLLLAAVLVPGPTANAANVPCSVNPSSGPIGTTFGISCAGFVPGAYTTAWVTEPDGAARAWPGAKADGAGNVGYAFDSGSNTAVGTWGFTVSQDGLVGVVHFTVTGGTEDVAGAVLTANGTMVSGAGFAPFEPVSIWFEFPNGDCSSFTSHWQDYNDPITVGQSVETWDTLKADGSGRIGFDFDILGSTYANPCLGVYKIVARGVDSGLGAWTTVLVQGDSVTETAVLTANKSSVAAIFDSISFSGMGFAPDSVISCWLTTPQGSDSSVHFNEVTVRSDGGGNFGFSINTGFDGGFWAFFGYMWSEGPLGEYAMTCDDSAGGLGIARFTVFGNTVDP